MCHQAAGKHVRENASIGRPLYVRPEKGKAQFSRENKAPHPKGQRKKQRMRQPHTRARALGFLPAGRTSPGASGHLPHPGSWGSVGGVTGAVRCLLWHLRLSHMTRLGHRSSALVLSFPSVPSKRNRLGTRGEQKLAATGDLC